MVHEAAITLYTLLAKVILPKYFKAKQKLVRVKVLRLKSFYARTKKLNILRYYIEEVFAKKPVC